MLHWRFSGSLQISVFMRVGFVCTEGILHEIMCQKML